MNMKSTDTPFILTSHHQAVKKLGKDLSITAASLDEKIVEAIEHKKYKNVLGVQFHPEPYILYQKGKYYKRKPGEQADLNLRVFLKNNPPTLEFHLNLWRWFSSNL
jgi:putative glutamine amidotransferase